MKTQKIKIGQSIKYVAVLAGLLLVVAPAYSEKAEIKDTAVEPSTKPDNSVLSVTTGDWNEDKQVDSAVLLKAGDQADLYLYLGNATGNMELKLLKKAVVWTGDMAGTLPQLKTEKAVLFIHSENDAIGRDRWQQRLSVDYRDKEFIVTGYTYNARDTLDPKSSLDCDVNLLTGGGIKNKKTFKLDKQKIKLGDWSDEKIPKQCRNN